MEVSPVRPTEGSSRNQMRQMTKAEEQKVKGAALPALHSLADSQDVNRLKSKYLQENVEFFEHLAPYTLLVGEGDQQKEFSLTSEEWKHLKQSSEFFHRLSTTEGVWKETRTRRISLPEQTSDDIALLMHLQPTFSSIDEALHALHLSSFFEAPLLQTATENFLKEKFPSINATNFLEFEKVFTESQKLNSKALETFCESIIGQALSQAIKDNDTKWIRLLSTLPIETLKLEGEMITDDSLRHLKNFKQLKFLDLKECSSLNGEGFKYFKHLPHLNSLNLFGCTGLRDENLKHFEWLVNLKTLDLSWCTGLTDEGLSHLPKLKQLENLSLKIPEDSLLKRAAKLNATKPFVFAMLAPLSNIELGNRNDYLQAKNLNLSNQTGFTNQGFGQIKQLTHLRSLDLTGWEKMTDADLDDLKELINLKTLILEGSKEVTDVGLESFKKMTQLEILSLANCVKVTDMGLKHLEGLISLKVLILSETQVTDAGLVHLKKLDRLTSLNLNGCVKLTDTGLAHLKGLPHLQTLSLIGCKGVTDEGLRHLKSFAYLKTLFLGDSSIEGEGLKHLQGLVHLENFYLINSGSSSGPMLHYLAEPIHLKILCFSQCPSEKKTGFESLQKFTYLETLSLAMSISNFHLQNLKGLTHLKNLDLSNCLLFEVDGLAPLQELTSLEVLDLTHCDGLKDESLEPLQHLTHLQHLVLQECTELQGKGLRFIQNLDLKTLYLDDCYSLTDEGIALLATLPHLETLSLVGRNQVTVEAIEKLIQKTRSPHLTIITKSPL